MDIDESKIIFADQSLYVPSPPKVVKPDGCSSDVGRRISSASDKLIG